MAKHDHKPACEHKRLAFCKQHDVPWCEDCGREWGLNTVTTIPYYPSPASPRWWDNTTVWGDGTANNFQKHNSSNGGILRAVSAVSQSPIGHIGHN